ncbi:hypothetical protein CC85DRAFT_39669 [Cutaneotrichosporon oleaginosum]|uniref:Uncharacterized protein n=1 Tax=Cutaneotrichosporon oleaginosum TaxID=879819 RepID=A0A0J0XRU5_9TREE|nr:uncharacterized protein CC85DRAFT_39669 [Cutaneotrichosporon oleaginosum]KLT43818.1 hypothetical protein CC85DRAFT_39669 [Cutaneotrichosporon oleaginosum]TXT06440.1 hypothetical protein COLE_05771 [Cutaneotrichosporon oleaginosum]
MTFSGDPRMSATVHMEITRISSTSTPPLDRYSSDHPARKRVDLRRPSSDIRSPSSVDQPADRLSRLLDLATTAGRPIHPTLGRPIGPPPIVAYIRLVARPVARVDSVILVIPLFFRGLSE